MSGTSYIAVVGSRDYPDASRHVYARLKAIRLDFPDDHFHIISGGAPGVDKAAIQAARKLGMSTTEYRAEWSLYGKRAGYIRNGVMAAKISDVAGRVIAFWDLTSRGTRHMIRQSLERECWVEVWGPPEDGVPQPAGQSPEVQDIYREVHEPA